MFFEGVTYGTGCVWPNLLPVDDLARCGAAPTIHYLVLCSMAQSGTKRPPYTILYSARHKVAQSTHYTLSCTLQGTKWHIAPTIHYLELCNMAQKGTILWSYYFALFQNFCKNGSHHNNLLAQFHHTLSCTLQHGTKWHNFVELLFYSVSKEIVKILASTITCQYNFT